MPEAEAAAEKSRGIQKLLLRNTALLMAAQVLATPLGVLVNAVMGRHLGAADFGSIYLASTFASFGFLFVQWGQNATLPAAVARDRSSAGEILGTGLTYQLVTAGVVYAVLALAALVLGYGASFQVVLAIVTLTAAVGSILAACQDTVRGFERTDVAALGVVGQQFMIALLVVPTLLLGGQLYAALGAQSAAVCLVLLVVWPVVRKAGIGKLSMSKQRLVALLREGTPFFALALIMALQPSIDAILLSKFAPAQTMGWHAAARKLTGVLVMPAIALISALYPTLCRLYAEDRDAYVDTARRALGATMLVAAPLAVGTAAYADIGIWLFSRESFGPAEDNLHVLSVFIALVYFTMTLGTTLVVAGMQRAWAITQFVCVLVSAAADPLLIPFFQKRTGNGGLGVCVATVLSELLMLGIGIWLAPRGLLSRQLARQLALTALAAGAMGLVAFALRWLSPFLAAPIAIGAYIASLWVTGGLRKEQLGPLADFVSRKLRRARS
jgi:O-antigen/teichoic acid export membrane protein